MNTKIVEIGPNRIKYTVQGNGPSLLMLHGWPFNSESFRHLIDPLSEHFTCICPDSPGLGETEWTNETDFSFQGLRDTFRSFADALGLDAFSIVAHDTGATIARYLTAVDPRVERLAIIDTEIPGHRPPWLPLFRHLLALPGSSAVFQKLLASSTFVKSSLGFGGCFSDVSRIDAAFTRRYLTPLVDDDRRMEGAVRYLRGIRWSDVDALESVHAQIDVPTLVVWGRDDHVFPVDRAELVSTQLGVPLNIIEGAGFLAHEERPEEVIEHILPFLAA